MDELNYKENSFPLLSPGTVLYDKYEILYVVGQGGCGRVYKARDINSHDTSWAVKEIFSLEGPSCFNMNVKEIFQREASMLSSLKHKNIPKIKEYFINEPVYYIVMEYIEGKTLQEIYKSEARIWTEKELGKLAISLCDVLEYLHGRSVVFRDLKTKNIIIDEYDVPKLIDFGIARYFRADQSEDTIKIGTVGYAAPEQYGKKGGGSDRRTDIYSLGVLLHYLATGEDPEEKEEPFNFTPIRELNQEISEDFEDLINKCIKFRKDERFVSVREVKKKIQEINYRFSSVSGIEKYVEHSFKEKNYSYSYIKKGNYYTPSSPPAGSKIVITQELPDDYVLNSPQKDGEKDVKITVKGNEKYIINLPPEGINGEKTGGALFMSIWLTGWTVGGILASYKIITDFNCFIFLWLCFWIVFEYMGVVTMINLITSMVGRVRVSFDREYMKIKIFWFGLFPVEKAYPLRTLSDLKIEKEDKNHEGSKYIKKESFMDNLAYVITLKHENKDINIPFKGKEQENRWLYNEIKDILKHFGCEKI
jgi:serine/threonine protein kinase